MFKKIYNFTRSSIKNSIIVVLSTLLLLWALGMLYVQVSLTDEVFDEELAYLAEPSQFDYDLSFIQIDTGDKISLWWLENDKSDEVILYLHGNAGRTYHLIEGLAKDYSVLSPAYPSYHESEGSVSDEGSFDTAQKSYDWLVEKGYDESNIIIYGHSMGGAVAINLASKKDKAQKLITVNTFNSVFSMCWDDYVIICLPARSIFPSSKFAENVKIPVRQYHFEDDKKVPYSEGQKLSKHFTNSSDYKFIDLIADTHSYFDIEQTLGK